MSDNVNARVVLRYNLRSVEREESVEKEMIDVPNISADGDSIVGSFRDFCRRDSALLSLHDGADDPIFSEAGSPNAPFAASESDNEESAEESEDELEFEGATSDNGGSVPEGHNEEAEEDARDDQGEATEVSKGTHDTISVSGYVGNIDHLLLNRLLALDGAKIVSQDNTCIHVIRHIGNIADRNSKMRFLSEISSGIFSAESLPAASAPSSQRSSHIAKVMDDSTPKESYLAMKTISSSPQEGAK